MTNSKLNSFFLENTAANNDSYIKELNKRNGGSGEIRGQIRTGKSGGYKNEMSPELIEKFDKWMKDGHKLNQGFLYKP